MFHMNKLIQILKTFGYRYQPTRIIIHMMALFIGITLGTFFTFPFIAELNKSILTYIWWISPMLVGLVILRGFWKLNKWSNEQQNLREVKE